MQLKMTQAQLAKRLKCSPAAISRRLRGGAVSLKKWKRLADELGVSLDRLVKLIGKNGKGRT
jgi:transcriptional regulator with XRE-family HTH domain